MGDKKRGWGPGLGAAPGKPTTRLSGSGFTAGATVAVVVDGGKPTNVTVDGDGRFSWEVPTDAGTHHVEVRGPRGGKILELPLEVV